VQEIRNQELPSRWSTIPRLSLAISLAAVFLIFSTLGFVGDMTSLGRLSPPHLALQAVLSGLFAVCYAVAGVRLRKRAWFAIVPIFLVQSAAMSLLGHTFTDLPPFNHADPHAVERLNGRLNFDGMAVILTICLSYACFVHVSIREGKRHGRAQLEKASLESELSAAHEVQSVLVSESIPEIPGFALETVYHPASQVGGDFFQIIPFPSGSTLIAVGDVSGKGLRAAMIVSLIIGTLRTLSSATENPAAILRGLNRQLFNRIHDGFATCLLIRVNPDGSLLLANAGHLPPYRNGVEVPIGGSLPLGLIEDDAQDSRYQEMPLELAPGESLVLLTDGVAEAQNSAHAIFGFERVASTLRSGFSIQSLAEAARRHGQTDDITVLAVTRNNEP
jgi:hypothetical protein